MPHLSLLPTILKEVFGTGQVDRVPEPMVMEDHDQVGAYVEAGQKESVMASAYLFHTAKICQTIQGCRTVADLGCGPASQLVHIASINRDIQFTGFDLSEEMMDQGNSLIAQQGLSNARVQNGDITRLPDVADSSFDAVITTMTLHQFPEFADVEHCFATINRILKPGAALYIVDFGRLKYLSSMRKFVSLDAANQVPVFNDDYENSLRAAFLKSELECAARRNLPPTIDIYQTFALPMLVVIKTPDKPLPKAMYRALIAKRLELSRRYRAELDDIRLFFKLGGMKNDPFSKRVARQGT